VVQDVSPEFKIQCKKKKKKEQTQNRTGEVAQPVECLPTKCEALSSNSTTAKNNNLCSLVFMALGSSLLLNAGWIY
jgi:hypothetical protein